MSANTKLALMNLTPDHFLALDRAMHNILSSTLASETYAQIVDGVPTCDVYKDYYGWYRIDYETNLEPSKEAVEIVTVYRKIFNLGAIHVDGKVCPIFSCLHFMVPTLEAMLIVVRLHNHTRMQRPTRENSSYDYCKWLQLYATILRFICTPNTMGGFANLLLISIRRFQFPNLLQGSHFPHCLKCHGGQPSFSICSTWTGSTIPAEPPTL